MRFNTKVEILIYGRKRALKADRSLESKNITIEIILQNLLFEVNLFTPQICQE